MEKEIKEIDLKALEEEGKALLESLKPTPEEQVIVRKQYKDHKTNINKLMKSEYLNDGYNIVRIVRELLRARFEHYENGAGVICAEPYRKRIVKSLKKGLDLFDYADNDDNFTDKSTWYKDQQKAYEKAFTYVGKHFDEWWD